VRDYNDPAPGDRPRWRPLGITEIERTSLTSRSSARTGAVNDSYPVSKADGWYIDMAPRGGATLSEIATSSWSLGVTGLAPANPCTDAVHDPVDPHVIDVDSAIGTRKRLLGREPRCAGPHGSR